MRILIAITSLVLGLSSCARKQADGPKMDPSIATLVPSDTVIMAGTRLEALLKTKVYQDNFADRKIPQIDDFAQRTGLDPRKDLWELLFASNGTHGVLLGRGKFGDEMMAPGLDRNYSKNGAQRDGYKGFTIFENTQGGIVLFNGTTAALGDVPSLHRLIDERANSHGTPAPMAALLKEIPPDAQFWAAYAGGPVNLQLDGLLANVNKLLSTIQTGTIYFDLRTGVSAVGSATCTNVESAQQVQAALRALVGLGRLSVPKNQPELAQVYDTIRVTQEGARVKLYIDVPEVMADKFLKLWLR